MKKIISMILAFMMLFGIVAVTGDISELFGVKAGAYYSETNGVYELEYNSIWKEYSDEITIAHVDPSVSGELTVPSQFDGIPVTEIGDWAFSGCSELTKVVIPGSVKNIGYGIFCDCDKLASISLPDNLEYIDSYSFDETAFYNNNANWQNGALYIGNYLIKVDNSLTSYSIKSGTTIIAGGAFMYGSIKNVSLPGSVKAICSGAFYGCDNLNSIIIPESVRTIGNNAFYDTGILNNESNWEDGVLYIGKNLICAESTISPHYIIKDGTLVIGERAFYNCEELESITFPLSLKEIGINAFENPYELDGYYGETEEAFNLIEKNDFNCNMHYGCSDPLSNLTFSVSDGTATVTGCSTSAKAKIEIPGKYNDVPVTVIGTGAFQNCSSLTEIILPDSIEEMGSGAFSGCTGLTDIEIPYGITEIKDNTFSGCTSLSGISFPDSVVSIGAGAFSGCSGLATVTIPNNVASIGDSAFSGCSDVSDVYFKMYESQYNKISIGAGNECLTSATRHYFSGEIKMVDKGNMSDYATTIDIAGFEGLNISDKVIAGNRIFVLANDGKSKKTYYLFSSLDGISFTKKSLNDLAIEKCGGTNDTSFTFTIDSYDGTVCILVSFYTETGDTFNYNTYLLTTSDFDNFTSKKMPFGEGTIKKTNKTYVYYKKYNPKYNNSIIPDNDGTIDFSTEYCISSDLKNWQTKHTPAYSKTTSWSIDGLAKCVPNSNDSEGMLVAYYCAGGLGSVDPAYYLSTLKLYYTKDYTNYTELDTDFVDDSANIIDFFSYYGNYIVSMYKYKPDSTAFDTIYGIDKHYYSNKIVLLDPVNGNTDVLLERTDIDEFNIVHSFNLVTKNAYIIRKTKNNGTCSILSTTDGFSATEEFLISDEIYHYLDIQGTYDCYSNTVYLNVPKHYTQNENNWVYDNDKVVLFDLAKGNVNVIKTGVTSYAFIVDNYLYVQTDSGLKRTDINEILNGPHEHSYTSKVTKQATCKETGIRTYTCSCGDSYTEIIPKTDHIPGDWETVTAATETAVGRAVKKCKFCETVLEEKELPKLKKLTDDETGIEVVLDDSAFNEEVSLVVEEADSGIACDIVDNNIGLTKKSVYNIKLMSGGREIQPEGTVKVRIPVGADYDLSRTYVYYIDTVNGTVKKLNAVYENGYMVFEVDHFSYYSIIEALNTALTKLKVKSEATVDYYTNVTIKGVAENLPQGYKLAIYEGDRLMATTSDSTIKYGIGIIRDSAEFSIKVIDAENNVQKDGNGKELSEKITVTVKKTFFTRIVAFFRMLFDRVPLVEIAP